jgi:hypothetical protein
MRTLLRLLAADGLKLRHSAALRLLWLLPISFLVVEALFFEARFVGLKALNPQLQALFDTVQVKMAGALWGGFFHPLMLAMLPTLLFRPEHRFKTWRHLHAMPVPRRGIFAVKATYAMLLSAGALALVWLLMGVEHHILGWLNPLLRSPFHGLHLAKVLAWMWVGSLPLLGIYLWTADRINSLAVPVVFGLTGLMLTIALTGQEVPQAWRRDLIPWVTPYVLGQRGIENQEARQASHLGGTTFQEEANILRLPSGKKIKTWQNIPDELLFPPPPPTPGWVLWGFSLGGGMLILALAWADAGRNRT